jgi:hypothetical protein
MTIAVPPEQQAANLRTARRVAASRLGLLGDYGELDTAQIPFAMREPYATELANIILSRPELYSLQAVQNARLEVGDAPNQPLESYSVLDRFTTFLTEATSQAERINPLSERNSAATRWTITGLLALGVAVFVGIWALRTAPAAAALPSPAARPARKRRAPSA